MWFFLSDMKLKHLSILYFFLIFSWKVNINVGICVFLFSVAPTLICSFAARKQSEHTIASFVKHFYAHFCLQAVLWRIPNKNMLNKSFKAKCRMLLSLLTYLRSYFNVCSNYLSFSSCLILFSCLFILYFLPLDFLSLLSLFLSSLLLFNLFSARSHFKVILKLHWPSTLLCLGGRWIILL